MTAPEPSGGRSHLEKQADELLREDVDSVELLRGLDFGFLKHNDTYADWHASTPLKPMVRALLLKELEMIQGAPPTKSYEWCYKFATLTVVGENIKFTLAMRPVKKGTLMGVVVRDLLQQARKHVSMGTVYADSEFCAIETFRALEDFNLEYVIPSPKNQRVKREIERMQRDVRVMNDYTIYGQIIDRKSLEPESTNLVLLPSTSNDEKTVAFTTNKEVSDEIALYRHEAEGTINRYRRRWGIENSYKTIKDFLAWTTSKNFTVRLFYFGFAVLLYNMWLLVDLLVQISLDVEHRYTNHE